MSEFYGATSQLPVYWVIPKPLSLQSRSVCMESRPFYLCHCYTSADKFLHEDGRSTLQALSRLQSAKDRLTKTQRV